MAKDDEEIHIDQIPVRPVTAEHLYLIMAGIVPTRQITLEEAKERFPSERDKNGKWND